MSDFDKPVDEPEEVKEPQEPEEPKEEVVLEEPPVVEPPVEEPKPKPKSVKRKPKPSVPPEVQEHMVSEALNEYGVLRDTANFAAIDKDAWVKNRVAEKVEQYHTNSTIRDAYDNWNYHHGGK